jgi:hypothetical protein
MFSFDCFGRRFAGADNWLVWQIHLVALPVLDLRLVLEIDLLAQVVVAVVVAAGRPLIVARFAEIR